MPARPAPSPFALFGVLLVLVVVCVFALEDASRSMLAESEAHGGVAPAAAPYAAVLNMYLAARHHVLAHPVLYLLGVMFGLAAAYRTLRAMAAASNRWRERFTGMALRTPTYTVGHPFGRVTPAQLHARIQDRFRALLAENPSPSMQVLLGLDEAAEPVYLTDAARSMHVHCIGQTGSGKTQSVLYPLLLQDVLRDRGVLFLDAKGSEDNELMFARMAAEAGRVEDLRIFSLAPGRGSLTYNPLYMTPDADPRQVAERFFSTVEPTMDNPYYKDKARELVVSLVAALASSGKQMTPQDVEACVADMDVLSHALTLASDRAAVREIESAFAQLGNRAGNTYAGLLTAIRRYNHPLLNTYDPDIVLEEIVDEGQLVGFSLPATGYPFLAKAIGTMVLQHVQQLGARRQMDRTRSQAPFYVYADEFFNFAYDGFLDAVNKLRDAHISMFLAHQDYSDLESVSPEFARGVWANTRNKIVLFQDDPDFCELLARSIGTRRDVENTIRRSVDGFLNDVNTFEASSREVSEFVLHPDAFKALRTGQAYLVQKGLAAEPPPPPWWAPWRRRLLERATGVTGLNLAMIKASYLTPAAASPRPRRRRGSDGVGLYALFLASSSGTGGAA